MRGYYERGEITGMPITSAEYEKERAMNRLKLSAMEAVKFRGHDMTKWFNSGTFDYRVISRCKKCGAQAFVNAQPLPNQINIGGSAVAVHCTH